MNITVIILLGFGAVAIALWLIKFFKGMRQGMREFNEAQKSGLAPGSSAPPKVAAFRIGSDGVGREATLESVMARRKAMQEHESAVAVMDRGDYSSAIEMFEKVLAETADDPDEMTYLNLAVCHAHLRRFSKALSVLDEALRRWPDNARLRQNYEAIKQDAR